MILISLLIRGLAPWRDDRDRQLLEHAAVASGGMAIAATPAEILAEMVVNDAYIRSYNDDR